MLTFVIDEAEAGARLDAVLAALSGTPRNQLQRWIERGWVRVNGRPAKAAQRVREGDALEVEPPEPVPTALAPEALPLDVLYEDADLVVVNKAAGMVVHPAPGHERGTLVHALLHHCDRLAGIGGVLRPGIVHRLDRDTSGVLVVAKSDAAYSSLAQQFCAHTVERVYWALARGVPVRDNGEVDRPIGRHRRDRVRMSVNTAVGRAARTRWRVLRRFSAAGVCWLEVRPETGRTHQIRVHLAASGLPLLGDPLYGTRRGGGMTWIERTALHAAVLGFAHPISDRRLRFAAPAPADFARALERLSADG